MIIILSLSVRNKLTPDMRINSQYFAQHAEDHVSIGLTNLYSNPIHSSFM